MTHPDPTRILPCRTASISCITPSKRHAFIWISTREQPTWGLSFLPGRFVGYVPYLSFSPLPLEHAGAPSSLWASEGEKHYTQSHMRTRGGGCGGVRNDGCICSMPWTMHDMIFGSECRTGRKVHGCLLRGKRESFRQFSELPRALSSWRVGRKHSGAHLLASAPEPALEGEEELLRPLPRAQRGVAPMRCGRVVRQGPVPLGQ